VNRYARRDITVTNWAATTGAQYEKCKYQGETFAHGYLLEQTGRYCYHSRQSTTFAAT